MHRSICLSSLLLLFLSGFCSAAFAGSWEPVDGPYSHEAGRTISRWIENQVPYEAIAPSTEWPESGLYKNLFQGTLIWAFAYGSSFDAGDFLKHFSNRDNSVTIMHLTNGGLILATHSGFFMISKDGRRPENSISSKKSPFTGPRERWFASAFNDRSEISFYFSEVGPFIDCVDSAQTIMK